MNILKILKILGSDVIIGSNPVFLNYVLIPLLPTINICFNPQWKERGYYY